MSQTATMQPDPADVIQSLLEQNLEKTKEAAANWAVMQRLHRDLIAAQQRVVELEAQWTAVAEPALESDPK